MEDKTQIRLSERIYALRAIGYILGLFPICTIFYLHGVGIGYWIFFIIFAFTWPHISYFIAINSSDPDKTELKIVIFNSMMLGILLPLISFNLLPSITLFLMVSLSSLGMGGLRLFLKGIASFILGAFILIPFIGIHLKLETNLIIIASCIPPLIINSLAIGYATFRLSNEMQKALSEAMAKEHEIAHINQVVQAVNSSLDLDEVMPTVMHVLQDIFSFDQIGIFLKDEQGKNLIISKYYGEAITEDIQDFVRTLDIKLEKDASYICRTFIKEKPYYISPVTTDLLEYFSPADKELYDVNPVKAYFLAPLFFQNQVLGTIVFANTKKAFNLSEKKIAIIQHYVSQVATAINNARLAEETQQALAEVGHINQVVQAVNSTLDFDNVAGSVMKALKGIFEFDVMSILLIDETQQKLEIHRAYGDVIQEIHIEQYKKNKMSLIAKNSVNTYVIEKNKHFYFTDLSSETEMLAADRSIWEILPFMSGLFLPLKVQNKIIGAIDFFRISTTFVLTEDNIQRIQQYVSHIAAAINNARMSEEIITAKKNVEIVNKKLEKLANLDGLTQIANRRYFDQILYHEWRRAIRTETTLSAIMIDIDFFKKYNDHYGHPSGDECLRSVAKTLSESLRRPQDLIARYGGEEFIALLPDTDIAGALIIGEKMRLNVKGLGITHSLSFVADVVTISAGIANIVPKTN